MPGDEVPITQDDDGTKRHFSIAIFQYGLAAYDLMLLEDEESYKGKFMNCVEWAIKHMDSNGGWKSFEKHNTKNPYSAMAQGEGVSLLIRAFLYTKETFYLEKAKMAKDFLLTTIEQGGVCVRGKGQLLLYEFPNHPLVLNGWIFASWGLFDYYKANKDKSVEEAWHICVSSIIDNLSRFDLGYWSKYNIKNTITSPFYHGLHIAQLNVMYNLTNRKEFKLYADRWQKQIDSPINRYRAFIYKAYQKVIQ